LRLVSQSERLSEMIAGCLVVSLGAQPAPPDDAETVARASRGPGAWKVTRQIIAFAIASSAY
jgi:hypothetical protein